MRRSPMLPLTPRLPMYRWLWLSVWGLCGLLSCSFHDETTEVSSSSVQAIQSSAQGLSSSSAALLPEPSSSWGLPISSSLDIGISSVVASSSSNAVLSSSSTSILASSSAMAGCYGQDSLLPASGDSRPGVDYSGLCCPGLVAVSDSGVYEPSSCKFYPVNAWYTRYCTACGNGICNREESHCSCPADCP